MFIRNIQYKTMKENTVVNSLWIDPTIDELQVLCMKSFIANDIDFHLYTYNEISNVPAGVTIKDANEIIDKSYIFKDFKNSYATFSDWFRVKVVHEVGGWWVDCDVLFIKKFDFPQPFIFSTEGFDHEGRKLMRMCNAIFKMPKHSAFGERVLQRMEDRIKQGNYHEIKWTEIGARIIGDEILKQGLSEYVVVPEVFCPNDYVDFEQQSQEHGFQFDHRTYAVHLWNSVWTANKKKPLTQVETGSFLEQALIKYS